MTKTSGFSLVELMIVVAIIGLLAGIALPAYQNHMLKAHRADGQGILLDMAARQGRFITQKIPIPLMYRVRPGLTWEQPSAGRDITISLLRSVSVVPSLPVIY